MHLNLNINLANGWIKRVILSTIVVLAIIFSYVEIFMWGMVYFEGKTVTFAQSLQVVIESLTTSGYGGFAPWQSEFMNYFILWMNITGVLLVFIAFPVFILPSLRSAIKQSLPQKVSKTGHVIICSYSTHAEELITELKSRQQDYVIIKTDKTKAKELFDADEPVLYGDPESEDVLHNAGIENAKAVVANASTDTNISIIFSVRNIDKDIKLIAVLADEKMVEYHKMAGADETITPRQLIGRSLAMHVPAIDIQDRVAIDKTFDLMEIDIDEGSELSNQTVEDAHLLEKYRINIIGVWKNGAFESRIKRDMLLDSKTQLLVAGDRNDLEKLAEKAEASIRIFQQNKILIVGYGLSGQAVADFLKKKNVEISIVDIQDFEGVDVTGDIRDPEVFQKANIEDASAVVITIQDDTTAVFATLMARNMNKEVYIIVRANRKDNVKKMYDAGADYVQSLATVSGRMLASSIFEDETALAAEKQINLLQLPAGRLAGTTLQKSNVRVETGTTILAVIRDHEKITSLDPANFTFHDNDEVIAAGTDESIHRFEEKFLN